MDKIIVDFWWNSRTSIYRLSECFKLQQFIYYVDPS